MRYSELLEYKRDITITNLGDKFIQRMQGDETIADYFSDGGLDSETGKPYSIDQEQIRDFVEIKLEQIEQADPSPNKQYVQWILLRYIDGSIELFEDILSTTTEMLEMFHNLKVRRQLPPEMADINKFKTTRDLWKLYDKVTSLWNAYQKKRGEETALAMPKGNATELYNDANVRVIIPNDEASACYYGQGTRWCTAATKGINYFKSYNDRGKLYIFIPKNPKYEGEKYQLHDGGTFLNEKDQNVDGGLKWLLYERFPIQKLRDLWIKLDTVIVTNSATVTTPTNGISASMYGFGSVRRGNDVANLIFVPNKPQHDGEEYRVRSDGTVLDETGERMAETTLRWLFDERFPDKELKDKFINPTEVYSNNEVRVVKPQNVLTNLYYAGFGYINSTGGQIEALFVFEPINPVHDGEEWKLNSDGKLQNERYAEIKDGVRWLFDERFPSQELKDKFIDAEKVYESSEVKVVRPNNYIARRYLGDGGQRMAEGYDMFIPTNPKSEGERYTLSDYGKVRLVSDIVSYNNDSYKPINWLFDERFPDKKLKDIYIQLNKNVFENGEVSVDMTDPDRGYFAKKYNYPSEYPPEGPIFIINPKHPSEDGEKYQVVIGENKIYNKRGHAVTDFRGLFMERFKDKSLLEFFNKKFTSTHEMNMSDTIDFTPPNVLDDILTSMKDYAFGYVYEAIDDWMVDDEYYYDWLRDEGYWNEEEDMPSDDAPSYIDYNDDVRRFVDEVDAITDITMDDINDQKYEMRDEDGIFHLSELPELVGSILKSNSRLDSRQGISMDYVEGHLLHLGDLHLHDTKDENGNVTKVSMFTVYDDDDGKQQRRMHLEKSYEI